MMPKIEIYSANYCSYCLDAKEFFSQRHIPFLEIDVTTDLSKREWLKQETKKHTLPQIFIDGISIGGYSDLLALEAQDKLHPLLHPASSIEKN